MYKNVTTRSDRALEIRFRHRLEDEDTDRRYRRAGEEQPEEESVHDVRHVTPLADHVLVVHVVVFVRQVGQVFRQLVAASFSVSVQQLAFQFRYEVAISAAITMMADVSPAAAATTTTTAPVSEIDTVHEWRQTHVVGAVDVVPVAIVTAAHVVIVDVRVTSLHAEYASYDVDDDGSNPLRYGTLVGAHVVQL